MDKMLHGEPLSPRVLSVAPQDDFRLLLTFDNGEKRIFDCKPLLNKPVFSAIRNKAQFDRASVRYGTVWWNGDIDLCPDCLYEKSIRS